MQKKTRVKGHRQLTACIIIILICIMGIVILNLISTRGENEKILTRMMGLSVAITIFLSLIYRHLGIVYGKIFSSNIYNYPIGLLGVICSLSFVFQVSLHSTSSNLQSEFDTETNLSKFAHDTVVKNWEKDTIDYPELNPMYENIFGMSSGNDGYFLTEKQWEEQGLNVPYVPFSGNEIEWHFAAQFCQEMVNIIRNYDLITEHPVYDNIPVDSPLRIWVIKFRLFMKDPIVRNVWEQYRYHFANVHIDAWITHHITEFIDKNPDFIKQQDNKWQQEKVRLLTPA